MVFLPAELQNAIERMRAIGSDTQRFEVKVARKALPESVAETISAFANRDGGTIILGLDEGSNFAPAIGFDAGRIADSLQGIGNDFTPPCRLEVERYPFEGAEIVVAVVDPVAPNERPCFITRKGMRHGSYVRTGDGDKQLTEYEIDRMREFRQQPAFDREPVHEASMNDLDASVLEAIVARNRAITPRIFGKMPDSDILMKLGAIAPGRSRSGGHVPTLAGLLAAGIYPQQFFPRLNITFTVYPGTSKAQDAGQPLRYLDSQPVNGSIPEMLMGALELLRKHMNRGAVINGALRREVTDYPILACREAIINALQHRDYSPDGRGSQVQINLFADRLEILNPGGLFGAASFSSIPVGISATRNARLSQLLEYTPYREDGCQPGFVIENRGTGLQQIDLELQQALMPKAKLNDYVSAFQITLFRRRLQNAGRDAGSWADFDAALLAELEEKGSMSVLEIMERSGLSRNVVSLRLRNLKKKGLIENLEKPKSPKQRYALTHGAG